MCNNQKTQCKSPSIETERLLLRHFTEEDLDEFYRIFRDEDVLKYVPMYPVHSLEEAKKLLEDSYFKAYSRGAIDNYAICLKQNGQNPKIIGYIGINGGSFYELGYAILKEYWNRGLTTEAAAALLAKAKADGLPYVVATHDRENPASGRVMQKAGMTYRYSYNELWQPKNYWVTFRLYQIDLNGEHSTDRTLWNKYEDHFVENISG